jgi:hypothetical protein
VNPPLSPDGSPPQCPPSLPPSPPPGLPVPPGVSDSSSLLNQPDGSSGPSHNPDPLPDGDSAPDASPQHDPDFDSLVLLPEGDSSDFSMPTQHFHPHTVSPSHKSGSPSKVEGAEQDDEVELDEAE